MQQRRPVSASIIATVITSLTQKNSIKVYDRVSEPDYANDGFWRIASGESQETSFLMTTTSAELLDFRVLYLPLQYDNS